MRMIRALLAALALAAFAPLAMAAGAVVQQKDSGLSASSGSNIATGNFAGSVTAGNTLIVFCVSGINIQTTGVTDTLSNTYTLVANGSEAATTDFLAIYIASNVTGGTDSATCTFASTASVRGAAAYELSGIVTSSPVIASSVVGVNPGSSGANVVTTGNVNMTSQPMMLLGFCVDLQGVIENAGTSPIAYTATTKVLNDGSINKGMLEYVAGVSTTGNKAATFQDTGFDRHLVSIVGLSETGGATPVKSTRRPLWMN